MKIENFNIKIWCVLSALVICCAAVEESFAAGWQWIDGAQVQSKMREGSSLWLIDVRGGAAFDAVHIEGSVSIPTEALLHKKFPLQKTLILVDDSLGQKAAREAADALVKKGQERVFVLDGGIASWKIEGRPVAEKQALAPGVNAEELKWALAQSVPLKVYDLRDEKEQKQGTIKNAETVPGKTVAERVEKLKTMLSPAGGGAGGGSGDKGRNLASRMKKPLSVVLVFPASSDAGAYTQKILQAAKADIRYLIGGYETMVVDTARVTQTAGSCPTCPKRGK